MKKALALILILLLALTGCGQTGPAPEGETGPAARPAPMEETEDGTALWFSGEQPDPQSMEPSYEPGTLSYEGALYPDGSGGWETALRLTRHFPQGLDPKTGEPGGEGYMELRLDSVGELEQGEPSPREKAALDERGGAREGERRYGVITIRARVSQSGSVSTGCLGLSAPTMQSSASVISVPCLLITDGDAGLLCLALSPVATVALEGAVARPPAAERPSVPDWPRSLYINDRALSREQEGVKDVWEILFLGEGTGGSYEGSLRLWHWRERSGAYPTTLCCVTGEAEVYEQTLSLELGPFEEDQYLSAGGELNRRQRDGISAMAMADCAGRSVIFTLWGDRVMAELPGEGAGVLEGRLSDEPELSRIHDESLELNTLAHQFHNAPLNPMPELFANVEGEGGGISGADMQEYVKAVFGEPQGVPLWMPESFTPLLDPTHMIEKRPTTLGYASFQYTEDGHWLDQVEPLYRRELEGMRGLQLQVGDDGMGPVMEIIFRYGERTVVIETQESPIGTSVMASIH